MNYDNTSVADFVKIMNVAYELYDTNSLMFKIKFNTMVSDFKIYSFISKIANGDKETIKNLFNVINKYDKIYKNQLKKKKHNKEQFGIDYKEPNIFAEEQTQKLTGLDIKRIRTLLAKRNAYNRKTIK